MPPKGDSSFGKIKPAVPRIFNSSKSHLWWEKRGVNPPEGQRIEKLTRNRPSRLAEAEKQKHDSNMPKKNFQCKDTMVILNTVEGILLEMELLNQKKITPIHSPDRNKCPAQKPVNTIIQKKVLLLHSPDHNNCPGAQDSVNTNVRKKVSLIHTSDKYNCTAQKPLETNVQKKKNRRGKNSKKKARKLMKIRKQLKHLLDNSIAKEVIT